jgi:hypothetical protein
MLVVLLQDMRWRHEARMKLRGISEKTDQERGIRLVERVEQKLEGMLCCPSRSAQNSMTAKVKKLLSLIKRIYKDAKKTEEPVLLVFCEKRATGSYHKQKMSCIGPY